MGAGASAKYVELQPLLREATVDETAEALAELSEEALARLVNALRAAAASRNSSQIPTPLSADSDGGPMSEAGTPRGKTSSFNALLAKPRKIRASRSPRQPKSPSSTGGKRIRVSTELDVRKRYEIGSTVQVSTNAGMSVLFATRKEDGAQVVIKTRIKEVSFKRGGEGPWRQSTEFQLNLPPIDSLCSLYEVLETPVKYYVVMEQVPGKDIYETMVGGQAISHVDAREIIRQILSGLEALHSLGRIHKDLKIENVVVDFNVCHADVSPASRGPTKEAPCHKPDDGSQPHLESGDAAGGNTSDVAAGPTLCGGGALPDAEESRLTGSRSPVKTKIIDFDTVEEFDVKARVVTGTDGYISPEAYHGQYSPASDMYAVGVIMYKLLTKRFPTPLDIFDDETGENAVGSPVMRRMSTRVKKAVINWNMSPFDMCPQAKDLCAAMLDVKVEKRPTAMDAQQHPWFQLDPDTLPLRRQVSGRHAAEVAGGA
eukprot:TRINITY_DN32625_c0_g1_i1.p1 TRINITY_DN32625_c0_g1~~TRINITY_DN32625_c0_g1_i1.p1  ORF type:complete len:486 (+),score=92.99 TRINITY_DN32625_c0_g1_i1:168-1625(+)